MLYALLKGVSRAISLLPLSWGRRVGTFLGRATWPLVPAKRRKMALRNVELSLGVSQTEAEAIVRRSWVRFGRMFMEVMAFPKLRKEFAQHVRIEGRQYLDAALEKGHGAVMPTSHSGNWELLGGVLALSGYPLVAVAQKQTNEEMDRLINEYRALVGMHVTYKTGVREMLRLLGKGYVIGMLMDQDAGVDGVLLPFFGRPAACAQGPAFLARMKEAPLVPVFIAENGDGTHTVSIKEAIWVERTDDKAADIKRTTRQLMQVIEAHVRAHPGDWFWLHDRWKYCERRGITELPE